MSGLRSLSCILFVALCGTTAAGEPVLQVDLRISPTAVLGDAVPVRVLFANAGDEATYLRFSGVDYGTEALTVCAYKEGRWYRTGQIHIDREVGSDRFDFVPLRPEHKFEAPLLAINDPMMGALEGLLLPETGSARFGAGSAAAAVRGRRTTNSLPFPGPRLYARTVPRWRWTSFFTVAAHDQALRARARRQLQPARLGAGTHGLRAVLGDVAEVDAGHVQADLGSWSSLERQL